MRFSITTLGCKVNAYESRYYAQKLEELGFEEADSDLDVCIINTCTVTNTAAAKSRQMIHRARRRNPGARIVVVGCYAQTAEEEEKQKLQADLIIGARHKNELAARVLALMTEDRSADLTSHEEGAGFESMPIARFEGRNRAFLKIQDGCNQFCSYCAIPFARGRERSISRDEALQLVQELEAAGHREIVLTGIHTGRWQGEQGEDLADLLKDMLSVTTDVTFRISSIEITEVTDGLIALLSTEPRMMPHLHIPVQSASNAVLQRMDRPYTVEEFEQRLDEIRRAVPDISISTDVICGFVGESDAEFEEMMQTLRRMRFSFLHVFPYSQRQGTKASRMGPPVDGTIQKERAARLLELSKELRMADMTLFREETVLVEQGENGEYTGYTRQYHPVLIRCDRPLSGRVHGTLRPEDGRYIMEV